MVSLMSSRARRRRRSRARHDASVRVDGVRLAPALEAVAAETETTGDRTSGNDPFVDRVAELNVHRTMLEIRDRSDVLDDLVERGEVTLVGAMYDVRSGVAHVVSGP